MWPSEILYFYEIKKGFSPNYLSSVIQINVLQRYLKKLLMKALSLSTSNLQVGFILVNFDKFERKIQDS